jgi:hypothetical protein
MAGSIAEFVRRYHAFGLSGSPFTLDQVADLERHLGLPLPAAFQAYLLIAGAEPPPDLVGSDCHGDWLYQLRQGAEELLVECGRPFELPTDAVVFFMHQGYQFLYFRADGQDDDPPVFYFIEGMAAPHAPERPFGRFTDWVAVGG